MKKLHSWCMEHQKTMIFIGIAAILAGLLIDYKWGYLHVMAISAVSHLCIILGEAVMVMFFLHIIIEERNHHEHITQSHQIIADLKKSTMEMVEKQSTETEAVFKDLIGNIKNDLFVAVLKDKMPHDLIKIMVSGNFFKPTFLRRNLKVEYTYKNCKDNFLHMVQRIEFDMEYVTGDEPEINYEMSFSLSDSPLAKYKFNEAGYRKYINKDNKQMGAVQRFNESQFVKREFGLDKEKDYFTLHENVLVKKNEYIWVYQIIEVTFALQQAGVVDNFFVNHHTLKADIIMQFPEDYEFNIYPTFPEEGLPAPVFEGGKKKYENIEFLIPGQGWGYSILRKN